MRTTLSLDGGLIKELMTVTGAKTKIEAIHLAISEFVRRQKLEGLKALSGKIHIDLDWRELEERELKAQEEQEARGGTLVNSRLRSEGEASRSPSWM